MLVPKGIVEAVEATRRARSGGADVELHLFGAPDPSNRTSCSEADLNAWSALDGVTWHGPTDDPGKVWREHHIAMLLSYREGLPRALVEASATGRPMIVTDTMGCREVVRDGREGILVPVGNIAETAAAIHRLVGDPTLRARLGAAARKRFEENFTEEVVVRTIRALYRTVLEKPRY